MRSVALADFLAVRRTFGSADYVAPYNNARQARALAQRFGVTAAVFI